MSDRVFIDTNIWVYFWLKENSEASKNKFTIDFIDSLKKDDKVIVSSIQIFNEISNVLLKKYKIESEHVKYNIEFLSRLCEVGVMEYQDVLSAISIREKYNLSYYDSLMIQTALKMNCSILYSEDLSHNQLFENKLRVINPFI